MSHNQIYTQIPELNFQAIAMAPQNGAPMTHHWIPPKDALGILGIQNVG
jgi:hypothetical protein